MSELAGIGIPSTLMAAAFSPSFRYLEEINAKLQSARTKKDAIAWSHRAAIKREISKLTSLIATVQNYTCMIACFGNMCALYMYDLCIVHTFDVNCNIDFICVHLNEVAKETGLFQAPFASDVTGRQTRGPPPQQPRGAVLDAHSIPSQ